HRQRCARTDVPEAEHRRAVRDDGHEAVRPGEAPGQGLVLRDRGADLRDAGRVGDGQGTLVVQGRRGLHRELAADVAVEDLLRGERGELPLLCVAAIGISGHVRSCVVAAGTDDRPPWPVTRPTLQPAPRVLTPTTASTGARPRRRTPPASTAPPPPRAHDRRTAAAARPPPTRTGAR